MDRLTIYQKPTCTTCRKVYAVLKDAGVDVEAIDYYTDRLSKAKLRSLLKKLGFTATDLLRSKEEIYRKLRLGEKARSEEELLDLMVKYPDLIQRPIIVKGTRAILARPAEKIKEIL